jgi:hypothetical protein
MITMEHKIEAECPYRIDERSSNVKRKFFCHVEHYDVNLQRCTC